MEETDQKDHIIRRGMLHAGSAALAGLSALAIADAQVNTPPPPKTDNGEVLRSPDHHLLNESIRGPKNQPLANRAEALSTT